MKRLVMQYMFILPIILLSLSSCSSVYQVQQRLRSAADYSWEYEDENLEFTYQSSNAPDLQKLYDEHELSKLLFGAKDDVQRIMRLTEYVYRIVPWDGSAPWPKGVLSTDTILSYAEEHDIGVNCRMKAIMLQELCLSCGIPARMISCIPWDPEDTDSHVIVIAYAEELNRWVWADPSFNVMLQDSQGSFVGISEVREGLISGESFQFATEAMIRNEELTKAFYLDYYMAKNLYACISPLEAQYGYEGSSGERTRIALVPASVYQHSEQHSRSFSFRESRYTEYMISNPDVFWQLPSGLKAIME